MELRDGNTKQLYKPGHRRGGRRGGVRGGGGCS